MDAKYLIIAGTNKAGTTSLYEYLASHPCVSASFVKQTFFFLDKEWQHKLGLKSLYDYEKGLAQYDNFFRHHTQKQYKLEASPEYLYAPGTPERLSTFFKVNNGKIIFILRNPVSRFISLFYFGKQLTLVHPDCTFQEFIRLSKNYSEQCNTSLMAYETGFYSRYIEKYINLFGRSKLKIYFFEDMMADSCGFMKKVANDLDLDETFYNDFPFEPHNKTVVVKNRAFGKIYLRLRSVMMQHTYKSKIGHQMGNIFRKTVTPLYRKMNMTELKEQISDREKIYPQEVYKDEKQKLESLLGIHVPW